MSGDMNPDETIEIINKYFGEMKANPNLPERPQPKESPIITDECIRCGKCVKKCNHGTLRLGEKVAEVADLSLCKGCKKCETVCPKNAIHVKLTEAEKVRREKNMKLKRNMKISGIIVLISIIVFLICIFI